MKRIRNEAMVYVFTGDGKGKTSAALGTAIRAIASGMTVGWVAWYKQASWKISEYELPHLLKNPKNLHIFPMGKGFFIRDGVEGVDKTVKTAPLLGGAQVVDTATESEHVAAAHEALVLARAILTKTNGTPIGKDDLPEGSEHLPNVDLLVLDEINNAVDEKLVKIGEVLNLIANRGSVHMVLTGRSAPKELVEVADLVSEIRKIKHPYDSGKLAIKGLDF